jgi:hypothetical protein
MIQFFMQIARSSRGERGWELAEWVDGAPTFRFWSKSSIEVRQHAHGLGATDENMTIEGQSPKTYRMPEGTGATVRPL